MSNIAVELSTIKVKHTPKVGHFFQNRKDENNVINETINHGYPSNSQLPCRTREPADRPVPLE